jgi:hypothetical protein
MRFIAEVEMILREKVLKAVQNDVSFSTLLGFIVKADTSNQFMLLLHLYAQSELRLGQVWGTDYAHHCQFNMSITWPASSRKSLPKSL